MTAEFITSDAQPKEQKNLVKVSVAVNMQM